tara:strand:+ start:2626 stop:2817 length:192 start_codon:yes stop_codon:yes gene_type:complete
MKIEEVNKVLRDLNNNDILKEYESINNSLLSEPHDEHTLMIQHCFQIEMSERFMQIIWKEDEK